MEGRGGGQGGGIYEGGSDGWTGVWVGGRRGRKNGSCRRREMGDGRWEDTAAPRFPKTCMPASARPLHALTRRPRAARGPGSDRGAARFARNFVVMAAVGPLILSSRRERGCWRSSGWSSGKESASRVPIRHAGQGLRVQNGQGWLCLWLCRGPGAPPSYLEHSRTRTLVGTPPNLALTCLLACAAC